MQRVVRRPGCSVIDRSKGVSLKVYPATAAAWLAMTPYEAMAYGRDPRYDPDASGGLMGELFIVLVVGAICLTLVVFNRESSIKSRLTSLGILVGAGLLIREFGLGFFMQGALWLIAATLIFGAFIAPRLGRSPDASSPESPSRRPAEVEPPSEQSQTDAPATLLAAPAEPAPAA